MICATVNGLTAVHMVLEMRMNCVVTLRAYDQGTVGSSSENTLFKAFPCASLNIPIAEDDTHYSAVPEFLVWPLSLGPIRRS